MTEEKSKDYFDLINEPVAILHQAHPVPIIDGICKPMKPGGYQDSSADIAFSLKSSGIKVVVPVDEPDPQMESDWTFPDTPEGIQTAIDKGAKILWANTVLYQEHPLEKISFKDVRIVGQKPLTVHQFDNKWLTNERLRSEGYPVAKAIIIGRSSESGVIGLETLSEGFLAKQGFHFPLMVKPIRGRGSDGVSQVDNVSELRDNVVNLLSSTVTVKNKKWPKYGNAIMVEEFLQGDEITVTVMPPGTYRIAGKESVFQDYWSLRPVKRFNHHNGVAPYNGVVAVVKNSLLMESQDCSNSQYLNIRHYCELAASCVGAIAPIRIDCREGSDGFFKLFDLNMKPNMTGAGRPGREDQDSLSCIAARAIGWSYTDLLLNMLYQRWSTQ